MEAVGNRSGTLPLDQLANELTVLRAKGLARATEVDIPALRQCFGRLAGSPPGGIQPHHYELALRSGVRAMGDGLAAECAEVLFGIAPHVRGLHPIELRKRAAELSYDHMPDRNTVDAFRKTREPRILEALAVALLRELETRAAEPDQARPVPVAVGVDAGLPSAQLVVDVEGWRPRTLGVLVAQPERPGQLRELTWNEFGQGIDTLRQQIHHYGTNLDIDLAIGINEGGLLIATLLASASFSRCAIGYVRTRSRGRSLLIDADHSHLAPQLATASAVLLCDYEVKTATVLSSVRDHLHAAGLPKDTPRYLAVMGALATEEPSLEPAADTFSLSALACHAVLERAELADAFVACLMASPGIDPPLGLR